MGLLLKRLAVALAVFVISGAAVLVATFFLFAAIFLWFEEFLRPALAALATTGSLLAFALLVGLAGLIVARAFKRKPKRDFGWLIELLNAPDGISAIAIGNALGRRLQAFARKNNQATIIAALAAGLALGVSPALRKILRDLLEE